MTLLAMNATPTWARVYLGAKDRLEESRIDTHTVALFTVLASLVVGYIVAAVLLVRFRPDTWRRLWMPWGIVATTVLSGMVPVAVLQLLDSHAESYRGGWP